MADLHQQQQSRWQDAAREFAKAHQTELLWTFGIALAFRILSAFVHKACRKRFKSEDESVVATYRLVGLLHHCVQVPIAVFVLLDPTMWQDRLFAASKLSTVMLIISSGYFLHDMLHALEHLSTQGFAYVLHGAGCASVYLFSLLHDPTMLHFYGAGFLLWELSSFPLHARWFLFKTKASSRLQLLNGLVLILSFFVARILWGYYLSWLFWSDMQAYGQANPAFRYTTMLANLALNALNTWWFGLMLVKAAEALGGKKDAVGKRD